LARALVMARAKE